MRARRPRFATRSIRWIGASATISDGRSAPKRHARAGPGNDVSLTLPLLAIEPFGAGFVAAGILAAEAARLVLGAVNEEPGADLALPELRRLLPAQHVMRRERHAGDHRAQAQRIGVGRPVELHLVGLHLRH